MQWKTCRKNFCNSARCSRVFLVFVHQNRSKLLLLKKSSTIPGKIFRDVDVRPLEQSCFAQHILSVLRDEQTLTNVDNKWQTITRDEIKENRTTNDFQPWSCGKWQELAYNRGSQVRLSNAPTEKRCKLKKNSLPNISINSSTFFRGIWRVMPRLYLKRSCT